MNYKPATSSCMQQKDYNPTSLPDLDLVFVEGGTFMMGDAESKYDRERTVHEVSVPSFYMNKYQVTQRLWTELMVNNPSRPIGDRLPVNRISWLDCQNFFQKINQKTKKNFRLPTEAEWEYAAKGGIYSQGFNYAGSDKLSQVGWYRESSNREIHEVGLLLPNELGLYDMSGNVWEWCEDDWHENYESAPADGSAWVNSPERGAGRVLRGGSYFSGAVLCRPAIRDHDSPDYRNGNIGFRLVLPFQSAG